MSHALLLSEILTTQSMGNKYLKTYAPACLIRMSPKVGSGGRGWEGEGRKKRNRGGQWGGGVRV